jgi:hypothetical protein
MRTALPVITEEAEPLKPRFQRAQHGRKKRRRQRRYLLASGHAQPRQAVAQRLGVHRHPVGHWLAIDEARGLDARLALDVAAGKPLAPPPDVLAAREQVRRRPPGFASEEAWRQWVKPHHHLDVQDHPLSPPVRTTLNATRPGPRPRPPQKPGRPPCLSSALSGAAGPRHSAGPRPSGARGPSGRKPLRPADGAAAAHGPRCAPGGRGLARLRVGLRLWGGGPTHGGALLPGAPVSACRHRPHLHRGVRPRVLRQPQHPALRAQRRTPRPAPSVAGACPPPLAPALRSGAEPARAGLARPQGRPGLAAAPRA